MIITPGWYVTYSENGIGHMRFFRESQHAECTIYSTSLNEQRIKHTITHQVRTPQEVAQ
jgi:hypothetical protein